LRLSHQLFPALVRCRSRAARATASPIGSAS